MDRTRWFGLLVPALRGRQWWCCLKRRRGHRNGVSARRMVGRLYAPDPLVVVSRVKWFVARWPQPSRHHSRLARVGYVASDAALE